MITVDAGGREKWNALEVRIAIQLAHFEAWQGHYAPRHLAQAKYLLHNLPMQPIPEDERPV